MARWLAVALALATAGCLEGAPEPLGPPGNLRLDSGIVATWRCVSPGDDDGGTIEISEPESGRYRLRTGWPGEEPEQWEGHVTEVGGALVLNVKEAGDDGWYFATLTRLRPDVLDIRLVAIEDLSLPVRDQVAAALTTNRDLLLLTACVPAKREP
jgi:hypothetical protein